MKKNGFSLAEVLITLSIIGVVAAMTIPTLMNNSQMSQYKTALKKNYSVFSGVYNQIVADNSSFKNGISACTGGTDIKTTCLKNVLKQYLKVIKDCEYGATYDECFPNVANAYDLDGDLVTEGNYYANNAGVVLADGTMVMIRMDAGLCSNTQGVFTDKCGWMSIDVNGLKKPNKRGKDIYGFVFYSDRLRPMGADGDGFDECTGQGLGCAANYLAE